MVKRTITWLNESGVQHEANFVLILDGEDITLDRLDLYPSDEDGPLPYRFIPESAADYRLCVKFILGTWLDFHKEEVMKCLVKSIKK